MAAPSKALPLRFPRKGVPVDAETKQFLDQLVIPLLLKGALEELLKEKCVLRPDPNGVDCPQAEDTP
jgi:hypothetical protein